MAYDEVMNKYERVASVVKTFIKGKHVQVVLGAMVIETVKIEPIKSSDGCNATYINAFNPGIVIENDLYVGKEVWFERNAGAVNILIHGKRLEGIMNGNEDSD